MASLRKIVLFSLAAVLLALPMASHAGIFVGVSVGIAPPALPVYVQPPCPTVGYLWTPGYWSYGDEGYFWVPGTWVEPPTVGLLWTPGYWGWNGGAYLFNAGYWGPTVGFYGGVNYGFGYGGIGFGGGEWRGGVFAYNRSVTNVTNIHTTNIYNKTVVVNNNHTSFNGPGGITRQPTPEERTAAKQPHREATSAQTNNREAASKNPDFSYAKNHGAPAVAATQKPGDFKGPGVVKAKEAGGKFNPDAAKPASQMPKEAPANVKAMAEKQHVQPSTREAIAKAPEANKGAENNRPATMNKGAAGKPPVERNNAPMEHKAAPAAKPPVERNNAPMRNNAPANRAPVERNNTMSRPAAPAERPAPQARPMEQRPAPQARPMQQRPAQQARPAEHAAPRPEGKEKR